MASAGVAITAAALGAGPWALVLQQVVLAAVTSALSILAARWRPSFEFSRPSFRSLSKFALPVTGGTLFNVVQPLVTALLIGSLVGVDELGLWSLSMAVVVVPATLFSYPLARVIYAAFARMRDNPERVAEVWVNGFVTLAAVVLPALFGLIAVAPDVIPVAFGPQWDHAVPVVQILAVFLMVRTLQTWNTPVMDAFGKPHVAMWINAAILAVLTPSIWFGSRYGIEGVAVAFSLASFICGELPSFILTTRALKLNGVKVVNRLRGIVISSAAACVAVMFLRAALEDEGVAIGVRVLLSIVVGAVAYCGCLTLSARSVARDLVRMGRGLVPALRSR
jgi:PST family polysaccharide transporter